MSFVQPNVNKASFTCPTCQTVALQRWSNLHVTMSGVHGNQSVAMPRYRVNRCDACDALGIWLDAQLVFPVSDLTIEPNSDMPASVKKDFVEAILVFKSSPKASAALLRLAVQRCCIELGLKGENLNSDIGELVRRGLPEQVRQSLDVVRVIGNNQVHPGTMDVNDRPEIALTLFKLVNIIVEYLISNPKRISELFDSLPEGARAQIERRDATADKDTSNA